MGKAWIQGPLEHGNEICSSFKSNEVIKIKSNRKSRNKSEKFSKKESSEIQGVTVTDPWSKGTTQGTYGRRPWLWMVSRRGFLLPAGCRGRFSRKPRS